ncbi:sodium-dependent nutrient amino acid transporter 1-like [Anticarsia gemmatalis]|uniref:sodium-dependent nutrient amino acid transporter 1-like n=1 Tax=Anticarsia gemmatalis TaxID=129554 RepID=UPI003F75F585
MNDGGGEPTSGPAVADAAVIDSTDFSVPSKEQTPKSILSNKFHHDVSNGKQLGEVEDDLPKRAEWGSQIEFLMSCIATSVGLGNVWRFPFVAYENGGGAFLIPYIIVLMLIGKPVYYLECILGQFSSRNSIRVWSLSPAMKGTGYGTILGCAFVLSYYVAIVALCLYYLAMSFQSTLPWAVCQPEWTNCVPSDTSQQVGEVSKNATSSAELYFVKTVLQKSDGIEGGLGAPVWYLAMCLLAAWFVIFVIVAQGVKSSGKAAYFLAIFPYVVMIVLLITTVILPGAGNGILYFLTPQWNKLIELDVWYAAITQVFFSLSVCSGAIIMFSSYNGFKQNVYRDAMIVTTLDTFTSLLSGITIFGILGNLAHELNKEVHEVIGSGGTGLAFISYPDAIAKTFLPQLFSVLFFLMMTVLGIGSSVALLSTINTVFLDAFPKVKTVYMSALCCSGGFLVGLTYVTPGGQYILELVDYYGGTFLILFCAIMEISAVFWIYGLESLCLDIEFMLGIKTSMYWRLCWGVITPAMMITVFIYALLGFENVTVGDYVFPTAGYVCGYLMLFIGIFFVPIGIILTLYKYRTGNLVETVKKSFTPKKSWGPRSPSDKRDWEIFKKEAVVQMEKVQTTKLKHIWRSLTGSYRS